MSLQAQMPNLDDRDYARIVAEAKALIPRYSPEWTDHNDSDPGITMVQLFAWMTEMTLYRLNQVPELNYLKFLELLGIELKPAQPAHAELTFKLVRNDVDAVFIPKGSQVAAASEGQDKPLIFETDEALVALGAQLAAIQSFDGFSYSVETTKNDSGGQWFYPFGAHAREGAALVLGFDSRLAFTEQQMNLAVYLAEEERKQPIVHCGLDLEQMPVAATIAWEYWDARFWQPVSLDKDDTRAFTRSGHVYLRGPGDKAKKDKLGEVTQQLYWIRGRLVRSAYEIAPRLDSILTNTVAATQAATVRDEILGGSDGRPNQTFRLASIPVLRNVSPLEIKGADGIVQVISVRLEVAEAQADDFKIWQEVEDFFASGPQDSHFVLNYTTGEIGFGDGWHGRIPAANPANPAGNIVARLYRYGGGEASLGSKTITDLQTFVPGVESATNLRPALGGAPEETLADAKLRTPQVLKSKDRAVTAEDFEYLALSTAGVRIRRAKALPLCHPNFTGSPVPGCITVIIVPDSDAPNPIPNEATLQIVCAHLNRHRLLTSEVFVVAPVYHKIKVEAEIIVQADADLGEVKRAVEDRLTTYFHPLRGGESGTGWEFGGDIFYSRVYRAIIDLPGVDRIKDNQLVIWLDRLRNDFCRDISIADGALVYATEHAITVSYSTET
jgi:predicted phage baseplate assembly protein